jgi:hypothetical protein
MNREEYRMMRTVFLGVALAFGLATAAGAAVTPAQVGNATSLVIKEGCGPGFWRGPGGKCHPMFDGRACPPGYHLGPEGKKCWPN